MNPAANARVHLLLIDGFIVAKRMPPVLVIPPKEKGRLWGDTGVEITLHAQRREERPIIANLKSI